MDNGVGLGSGGHGRRPARSSGPCRRWLRPRSGLATGSATTSRQRRGVSAGSAARTRGVAGSRRRRRRRARRVGREVASTYREGMVRGSRVRTLVAVALSGALVSTFGAGCSLVQSPPTPDDTARALAAGLATGDLDGRDLQGHDPRARDRLRQGGVQGPRRPAAPGRPHRHEPQRGLRPRHGDAVQPLGHLRVADRLDVRDAGQPDARRRPVAGLVDPARRGPAARGRRDARHRPQVATTGRRRRRLRCPDHDRARGVGRRHRQGQGHGRRGRLGRQAARHAARHRSRPAMPPRWPRRGRGRSSRA